MPKPRKLTIAETPTGQPPSEDAEIRRVLMQCQTLVVANWSKVRSVRDGDPKSKLSLSFRVTLDHGGKKPRVKTKLSFTQRWADEEEGYVQDELPLGDGQGD